jgi:tRNA1(Val) A37 N6-methylase TrmN6
MVTLANRNLQAAGLSARAEVRQDDVSPYRQRSVRRAVRIQRARVIGSDGLITETAADGPSS